MTADTALHRPTGNAVWVAAPDRSPLDDLLSFALPVADRPAELCWSKPVLEQLHQEWKRYDTPTTALPTVRRPPAAWKRAPRRTVHGGSVTELDLSIDLEQVADDVAALQGSQSPASRGPGAHPRAHAFASRARASGKTLALQQARAEYAVDETHVMIFDEAKDWFERFTDIRHDTVADLAERSGVPPHLLDPWSYQADAEARWLDGDALIEGLHLRR